MDGLTDDSHTRTSQSCAESTQHEKRFLPVTVGKHSIWQHSEQSFGGGNLDRALKHKAVGEGR